MDHRCHESGPTGIVARGLRSRPACRPTSASVVCSPSTRRDDPMRTLVWLLAACEVTPPGQTPPTGSIPDPTDDVGNHVDLDRYPPVVIATVPRAGALDVDPALQQMSVLFSKPMLDESWSWVQID